MNVLRTLKWGLLLLLLALLMGRRLYFRYWDPSLTLTFFDVGQGDAALVQFPRGKTMLIDSGGGFGKWNVGSRVLFPELARLGVLHLNYAVMSHPDNDHARGFTGIFQDLSVDEFWFNRSFEKGKEHPLLVELEKLALEHGIMHRAFSEQTVYKIGGASIVVLPMGEALTQSDTNNRSLVILVEFAGCRFLFTGDIEARAEAALLRKGISSVTLVKVPHHGSKTSSTWGFLKSLDSRWAVVSVGVRNSYGHPRPEVLDRYRVMGTQILRTDFHGAVRFRISPKGKIECETAKGASCGQSICTH